MAKNPLSSILDELMGRDRNTLPDELPKTVSWDDPDICSHYMVCFCPNELFVNTKADLGPCHKVHDEQLRKKYQEGAPNGKKFQFENEFIRFCEKMIKDINGKIERGRVRIALANGPDGGAYGGPGSKNAEKIALLTERINGIIKEAEEAGCEGDIEKAQGLLKLCDELKKEREALKSNEVSHPWNPDKAMQVCEVCGSYLIIGEAQHRLDDHIMGKQHMGFALLRKTMDDVKKAKSQREIEEREKMEKERVGRNSNSNSSNWGYRDNDRRGGGRDRGDRGGRYHRGSRSRSRDKKKKKKSRSRSRDRRRSRSKDRKKDRRDGDSSRDRKSRKHSDDKDREKEKKRHKRSRSRSRDKHRKRSRSGSREKDRKKEKISSDTEKEVKAPDPDEKTTEVSTSDGNSPKVDSRTDAERAAAEEAEFEAAMRQCKEEDVATTDKPLSHEDDEAEDPPPPGME